jgi:hypothetical protein
LRRALAVVDHDSRPNRSPSGEPVSPTVVRPIAQGGVGLIIAGLSFVTRDGKTDAMKGINLISLSENASL